MASRGSGRNEVVTSDDDGESDPNTVWVMFEHKPKTGSPQMSARCSASGSPPRHGLKPGAHVAGSGMPSPDSANLSESDDCDLRLASKLLTELKIERAENRRLQAELDAEKEQRAKDTPKAQHGTSAKGAGEEDVSAPHTVRKKKVTVPGSPASDGDWNMPAMPTSRSGCIHDHGVLGYSNQFGRGMKCSICQMKCFQRWDGTMQTTDVSTKAE